MTAKPYPPLAAGSTELRPAAEVAALALHPERRLATFEIFAEIEKRAYVASLTATERHALLALIFIGRERAQLVIELAVAELARLARCNERTARRCIENLEARAFLRSADAPPARGRGKLRIFRLMPPPGFSE